MNTLPVEAFVKFLIKNANYSKDPYGWKHFKRWSPRSNSSMLFNIQCCKTIYQESRLIIESLI